MLSAIDPSQPPPPPLQHFLEQPVQRVQQYQALLKVSSCPSPTPLCPGPAWWVHPDQASLQELIRNKARNRQNCALLEQAYAVVSALPQRAENQLHVSLMENYPGTLEALGEPIRQVCAMQSGWGAEWRSVPRADQGLTPLPGPLHCMGRGTGCADALEGPPPPRLPVPPPPGGLQAQEGLTHRHLQLRVSEHDEGVQAPEEPGCPGEKGGGETAG